MKKIIALTTIITISVSLSAQTSTNAEQNIRDKFNFYRSQYSRLRNEGKTDSIFYISRQCYQLAQTAQNDSLLFRANILFGNAFLIGSEFAQALEYYFKSLAFYEKKSNYYVIGSLASNIAFTLYQLGHYSEGIHYGKRAIDALLSHSLSLKDVAGYYGELANDYDNTGINFLGLNEGDSALKFLQEGYEAVLKSKNKEDLFIKAGLLTDMARAYELLNEQRMAENYFKEAFYLNDSLKMLSSLAYGVKYYGAFLLKQGRLNDVKHYGKIGIDAAVRSQDKISVIDIAKLLEDAYEATNIRDSAFIYAKMVNNYRDTVFSSQKMIAVQNAVFKREMDEKEALLQEEKQKEERKHNLQYAGIALGVVSFLILFFVLSHSIIANQKLIRYLGVVALLIVFEFINLYIHPYLSHATNDSPLLMLLVMVCIAALLVPLHHRMEHWITHKLVEKNNKIRLAAAKKTIQELEGEKS